MPTDTAGWRDRSALSILVNEFNREEAFSNDSPWGGSIASGSPLHWAIREDNLPAVSLLIQNESDVNQVDSRGKTPLELAISSDYSAEIVEELLAAGADSAGRLNAMIKASEQGELEVIKVLAEADPEILTAADRIQMGGLVNNAGSVEVFQYLHSQGLTPINITVVELTTASFKNMKDEFAGFFFNSGLVSQSTEGELSVAFNSAFDDGDLFIIRMLHYTVSSHNFATLINHTKYGWASPLCVAAGRNSVEQVEFFITLGAKIDLEGSLYGSPLMTACALGCFDVVRQLVRSGAELLYVSEEGLLRSAVSLSSRHHKVTRWLLVDRHVEQRKLEHQPAQCTSQHGVWGGPRLFKLELPAYVQRDFGESRWDHLRRLQEWKEDLIGVTMAESRTGSGLDFEAELEAESRKSDARAAHRQFLARLGEA